MGVNSEELIIIVRKGMAHVIVKAQLPGVYVAIDPWQLGFNFLYIPSDWSVE